MASRISVSIKKASDLFSMTAKPTFPMSNLVKLISNAQRQFMCSSHATQILKSEPGYQSESRFNQKVSNIKLVTFRRQGWWSLVSSRNISSCTKEGKPYLTTLKVSCQNNAYGKIEPSLCFHIIVFNL